MASGVLQIVGLVVGGIGLAGTFAVTGMPQWRVTAFIENNIIVFETIWEGLWMHCIRQANIRMQCKVYDSLLALSPDLQASRGLMCSASALSFLAFMIAVMGMKCTQCTGNNKRIKGHILLAAGILFILSGIVVFIPVCWVANTIIRDFYNPVVNVAQKRELGEALYIGWARHSCGGISRSEIPLNSQHTSDLKEPDDAKGLNFAAGLDLDQQTPPDLLRE
ncbi:hypothetical protein KIL84_020612 [Mauremys mutica]|uniref:Claudin n=1 Tax=Mauremys mutica TaxID=74926 RepID=A0A9D3XX49_9SAUR|nr:hypothetical protein KIL84_020612 [Mauremys mutica]